MSKSETVLCDREGPIAVLTLNRPEKRNAMNRELVDRLFELIEELDSDPSIRAIILTGAGPAFCAGVDAPPSSSGTCDRYGLQGRSRRRNAPEPLRGE